MENKLFPDPRGLALLGAGAAYLLATPGVLAGFLDTYLLAPLQRARAPAYGPVRALHLPPDLTGVAGRLQGSVDCATFLGALGSRDMQLASEGPRAAAQFSRGRGLGATAFFGKWRPSWWRLRVQEDIKLGRKIATGGFGTVFKGDLFDQDDKASPVIVKKVRLPHAPTLRS